MRKDMKDLIVNTSRRKYGEKRSSSVVGMTDEQMEALPCKQGIRRNHTDYGFEFGDRLGPLWDYLKKHAGRPWNEVWSEICEHADIREIRGYHLREHVQQYVTGSGGEDSLGRWYRHGPFWVDDDGILRFKDYRRYHYRKPAPDPDNCKVGDRHFERVNGCWFEVWYMKTETVVRRWSYSLGRNEVVYSYEDTKSRQKQLSKKELRDLGLSNDPDFEWWNNGRSTKDSE